MEEIAVGNLSFCYPETGVDVLKNISFSVNCGELITLCGPSGSGKTTLLRQLKPALAPHGIVQGEIKIFGKPLSALSRREQSQRIGFVMQSPDNQIVTDKVWHELAFGLESLGYDNQTIRKRVAETAAFFGIQNWFDKGVNELSGGQKQLLNLASIMAVQPDILILDEPTSQLDPIAASDFLSYVSKINRELGVTVLITEHRLDEVLPLSDRVLVLDCGRVVSFDTPKNTGANLKNSGSKIFLSMPAPMQIWQAVENDGENCPVTVAEGRSWLENYSKKRKLHELYEEKIPAHGEDLAVELKDVWFRYEKDSPDIIKGMSLNAYSGEFVTILGGNGAGKSTALSLMCGLNAPYRGKVKLFGNGIDRQSVVSHTVAMLPQNPQSLFVKKTVLLDLEEILDGKKLGKEEKSRLLNEVISLCRLEHLLSRHPYDLSGGEQQRAALAKVLLLKPKILLLDEPTKGMDAEFKITFARIIKSLTNSGITVIMVSHDVEFCAKYSHRCMMMFGGEIVSSATPRRFFASNSFYATCANRMSRAVINDAVTAEDVIYCCTGIKNQDNDFDSLREIKPDNNINSDKENKSADNAKKKLPLWKKILGAISACLLTFGVALNLGFDTSFNNSQISEWLKVLSIAVPVALLMICFGSKSKRPIDEVKTPTSKRRLTKRTTASLVMIMLAIPLTLFVGSVYLREKKYLFISLLILLECMLPFFIVFEGRKPQARELVIIAVLCALAIASRTVFYMLPQIKPVAAIVIISAVAFGGETGFLVGSLTMLTSNVMFGQGPWTPWQMFAMGIIGFLSGVLFRKGVLARDRASLCVFGFLATIVIYGGLMNFYAALSAGATMNFELISAFYITGFPMDILHALSTAVFLYFASEPMLEKLDRVKTKYGLLT